MGQLRRHVADCGVTPRIHQHFLVFVQFSGHRFQLGHLVLHGLVQAAVFDSQAGLAEEALQGVQLFSSDRMVGDEVVHNDNAQRTLRRKERGNDKAVFLQQPDQILWHRVFGLTVPHHKNAAFAQGPQRQMLACAGIDLEAPDAAEQARIA